MATKKKSTSVRLTDEAVDILARLQKRYGVGEAVAFEIALRIADKAELPISQQMPTSEVSEIQDKRDKMDQRKNPRGRPRKKPTSGSSPPENDV